MKKFMFSLQKVLEYKMHMEDYEKNVLGQMRVERLNMVIEAQKILKRQQMYRAEYENRFLKGVTIRKINMLYNNISILQEKYEEKMECVRVLDINIDRQVNRVLEVSREKTSMEKLRQKHHEAYQYEENKAMETLVEEFVKNQMFANNLQMS